MLGLLREAPDEVQSGLEEALTAIRSLSPIGFNSAMSSEASKPITSSSCTVHSNGHLKLRLRVSTELSSCAHLEDHVILVIEGDLGASVLGVDYPVAFLTACATLSLAELEQCCMQPRFVAAPTLTDWAVPGEATMP